MTIDSDNAQFEIVKINDLIDWVEEDAAEKLTKTERTSSDDFLAALRQRYSFLLRYITKDETA